MAKLKDLKRVIELKDQSEEQENNQKGESRKQEEKKKMGIQNFGDGEYSIFRRNRYYRVTRSPKS